MARRRSGRGVTFAVFAVALAAGAFAILFSQHLLHRPVAGPDTEVKPPAVAVDPARAAARLADRRLLAVRRAANLARVAAGLSLPGTPDLNTLPERLAEHGVAQGAAVLIRIFKREHELELWLARDGRFHRFATYPICQWSGGLGPKFQTGDHQAPEGFYTVSAAQLNPDSRWYRSFNLGFPNVYDRAYGRTGSALMVHGGCSSSGCYAMTNPVMGEIWSLVTSALRNGQHSFQVQAFPFRMTGAALEDVAGHPDAAFWRELKRGYDLFETTQLPPAVTVCNGSYRFARGTGRAELTPAIKRSCRTAGRLAGISR
ncbi:MAG: murein L,D-transpeptidase [Hyphomicrobiaceae bacterium]|nr:murein L,D-transpeptidase [Hyphomicrobiaceae bacterium]